MTRMSRSAWYHLWTRYRFMRSSVGHALAIEMIAEYNSDWATFIDWWYGAEAQSPPTQGERL